MKIYVWRYFAMFDLQSDKSLGHHSAHWQVNGWILLLSRASHWRALTTHSAEGSTRMAPAPVREPGGLLSDRPSQEQTCQAPQKYKKVHILLFIRAVVFSFDNSFTMTCC